RAKHEQLSLSLGDDLSAARLSLDVLECRPSDLSAQPIYNFSVARVVENIERADLQPWREPSMMNRTLTRNSMSDPVQEIDELLQFITECEGELPDCFIDLKPAY